MESAESVASAQSAEGGQSGGTADRLIEAAYDLDLDDGAWIATLTEAFSQALAGGPREAVGYLVEAASDGPPQVAASHRWPGRDQRGRDSQRTLPPSAGRRPARWLVGLATKPQSRCALLADLQEGPKRARRTGARVDDGTGPTLALVAGSEQGGVLLLASVSPSPEGTALCGDVRWQQAAELLLAAFRLRRRAGPRRGAVTVDPRRDGASAVHASAQGTRVRTDSHPKRPDGLRRLAVTASDTAASCTAASAQNVVHAWDGLLSGDLRLVDHFDEGGRHYMILQRAARHTRTLLSGREREVVQLVAAGIADKEIAERLQLSASTVATHRTRGLLKLGVPSRMLLTQLISGAREAKLDS